MNARILVETKGLSREAWLEYRRKGIGGSDVAAILGISRWQSPSGVWMDKTGQAPPDEEISEAMEWGTILEPVIREHFREVTGKKVVEVPAILQHPRHGFMIADLDGLTVDDGGSPAVFEAKTASAYRSSEWEDGVPAYYKVQVMHYLAVTGFSKAYVAVLIGGSSFRVFEVDADTRMQDAMIKVEEAFWDLVVHKTKPPVDGSGASAELLDKMFKGGDREPLVLPEESAALAEAYIKASEAENRAKDRKREAANRLKEMMKDHDRASCGGHTVSWVPVSSEKFDAKSFKLAEPELYRKYAKESSYRRFTVK